MTAGSTLRTYNTFHPQAVRTLQEERGLVRGGLKAHPSLQRLIKHVPSHRSHPSILSLTLFIQSGQAVNWHRLTLVGSASLVYVH